MRAVVEAPAAEQQGCWKGTSKDADTRTRPLSPPLPAQACPTCCCFRLHKSPQGCSSSQLCSSLSHVMIFQLSFGTHQLPSLCAASAKGSDERVILLRQWRVSVRCTIRQPPCGPQVPDVHTSRSRCAMPVLHVLLPCRAYMLYWMLLCMLHCSQDLTSCAGEVLEPYSKRQCRRALVNRRHVTLLRGAGISA